MYYKYHAAMHDTSTMCIYMFGSKIDDREEVEEEPINDDHSLVINL